MIKIIGQCAHYIIYGEKSEVLGTQFSPLIGEGIGLLVVQTYSVHSIRPLQYNLLHLTTTDSECCRCVVYAR